MFTSTKNLILQHFDGEPRELDQLSIDNISRYAASIGADYRLITGRPFRPHLSPACQKVHLLHEEFDDWDNVLMLDIDMFATRTLTENVFAVRGVGLHVDVQQWLHRKLVKTHRSMASLRTPYWGGAIYKMDRPLRRQLRSALGGDESWMDLYNPPHNYEDEGIMHTLAFKSNVRIDSPYLARRWCQCSFLSEPERASFIHVRTKIAPKGPKREKIENYRALEAQGIL